MEEKHCKWYNDEFCTNDKSPCVADYCPVVEYPELCKHMEVVKDINVRSKDDTDTNVGMTDEEIVKALECCANDGMCRECPYFIKGIDCGEQRSEKDYLDLIHRLQGDYSNLKERYVKVLDLNEKVITEQKAEIERLKDENIEQRDIHFKNLCEYKDEIARLEKQVDELKTENKELYKEHTTLIAGSILKQQDIVKDTAREILQELYDQIDENTPKWVGVQIKIIAKRKGVEVE